MGRLAVVVCRRKKNTPGYTLIEALAVVFIIATVGTALLANYSSTRERRKAFAAAHDTTSALREVQTNALGGVNFGLGSTTGYGVRFAQFSNVYTLFADKDSDGIYDAGGDYVIEARTFKEGLISVIYGVCTSSSFPLGTTADVVFVPPHPTLLLTKDGSTTPVTCTNLCVNFLHPNGQSLSRVVVDKNSGLLDSRVGPFSQIFLCP